MKKILVVLSLVLIFPVIIVRATNNESLRITELMPNPQGSDAQYEWMELKNYSNLSQNLNAWLIEGHILPDAIIDPGEIVIISANPEALMTRYSLNVSVYQLSFTLPNSGSTILMENSNTNEIFEFDYPQSNEGKSFELLDGDCNIITMHPDSHTIGQENSLCTETTPVITPTPTLVPVGEYSSNLIITKVNPNPVSGEEWIEVKNIDTLSFSLSGWIIKDLAKKKYNISEINISPGESIKIYPTTVSLNNSGDTLYLNSPDGNQIDIFHYPKSEEGEIWEINLNTQSIIDNSSNNSDSTCPSSTTSNSRATNVLDVLEETKSTLTMPKIYRLGEWSKVGE